MHPKIPELLIGGSCTLKSIWFGEEYHQLMFFFLNPAGVAITVNGARNRIMMNNFVRRSVINHPQLLFQEDGATAHTSRETILFQISRKSNLNRSSRLPDLTASDFFLWG